MPGNTKSIKRKNLRHYYLYQSSKSSDEIFPVGFSFAYPNLTKVVTYATLNKVQYVLFLKSNEMPKRQLFSTYFYLVQVIRYNLKYNAITKFLTQDLGASRLYRINEQNIKIEVYSQVLNGEVPEMLFWKPNYLQVKYKIAKIHTSLAKEIP